MRALLSRPHLAALAAVASFVAGALPAGCSSPPPADPGEGAVAAHAAAVLNGVDANTDTDANVVGIRVDEERICSGSLIGPNLVLTARHCVSRNELDNVICGENALGPPLDADRLVVTTDADTTKAGVRWLPVAEVWLASGDDDVCGNDIALLLLESSIEGVEPLKPYVSQNIPNDQLYSAIGYGGGSADGSGVGVRRVGYDFRATCVGVGCQNAGVFRPNEWRGGPIGHDVCHGDSGGPAKLGGNNVAGVLSRLLPIGEGNCGVPVYTSTYAWAGFLQTRAVRAAMLGGYALPAWVLGGGDPPSELRFGNVCQSNTDCTSKGTCVFDGTQGYCSYDCKTTACPSRGYECNAAVGLCVTQASTPTEMVCFDDGTLCSEARVTEQVKDGGSCALAGAPGRRGGGGAWLIGLAALAGCIVRRHRTM